MKSIKLLILTVAFAFLLTCAASCGGCNNTQPEAKTPAPTDGMLTTSVPSNIPLAESGSIHDEFYSFVDGAGKPFPLWSDDGELSDFQKAYFRSILFKADSIDETSMKAEVTISLPKLSELFEAALSEVFDENADIEYNDFLEAAETKVAEMLGSEKIERTSHKVELELKRVDGELRFAINDKLSELVVSNIENALLDGYKKIMEDIENGAL